MHEKSGKFISVLVQTKEHTQSNIVYSALHGTVHSLCMISIVMLRSVRMKLFISILIVCLLEQYICSYACLMEFSVILHCGGSYIHIYSPYGTVLVSDAVNGVYTLKNVLYWIHLRILTCLYGKSLVSHIL